MGTFLFAGVWAEVGDIALTFGVETGAGTGLFLTSGGSAFECLKTILALGSKA